MVDRVKTSDNEWYKKWQRVVQRVKMSDNKWQKMTTSGNEWQWVKSSDTTNDNEWQRMVQQMKTNKSESKEKRDFGFWMKQNMQYITTMYSTK